MLLDNAFLTARGQNIYDSAINYLQELKEGLSRSVKSLNLETPLRMIEQMVAEPSLVDEMYHFTLSPENGDDYEIFSSVNNMVYCFKIAKRKEYTPFDLTEICLAALHHDIGMFQIPKSITNKAGHLTPAEWTAIKKHTETGRDLVRSYDHAYPNLSRAIYEHHERESGQGYPVGMKGERICESARIIGICDSYEAMTHNRPYRKTSEKHVSVLELAETKGLFFASHIVKSFLDEMTMYPIGSHVRLNNKAIGIVVATNSNNPFKPTVRLISDGQGNKILDETLINLGENSILNIFEGIPAGEVPK